MPVGGGTSAHQMRWKQRPAPPAGPIAHIALSLAVRQPHGQPQVWPPLLAEMAADGGHCTLSPRTAQAASAASLQAFSASMRRGMTFALAPVARVRTSAPARGTVAHSH